MYNPDEEIGAVPPPEDFGLNAWGNFIATKGAFEAGIRFESYTPALLGYPAGEPYNGSGIGFRYARYTQDDLEITWATTSSSSVADWCSGVTRSATSAWTMPWTVYA
ncbi:MAG: hypothetical protein IPI55_08710 [Flavobacteriales bacterium]|nr:hypothetical protein [Flavobacteriales bacterium]